MHEPDEWRETLEVSIETFPWLVDHCFYRQPDGWDDPADHFPVLPMTTMVELLGQAAGRLSPDRVVTRIDNIRASRWLTAAPSTPVVLKARRRGPNEVEASIEGYVRATVLLAEEPAPPPPPSAAALHDPRPSPIAPGPLYADHWMFHGPTFQGVRAIHALGDDGVDGQIEVLPTPGAFLDNAGQLYGWWVMATADADFLALPQSIERIEFFGPPLPPGTMVDTTVRIVDLDARTVRADLELGVHDRVAVRITGWVDRRFDSDADLWLMLRQPEHHLLATPIDAGYVAVEERWRDSASRELMARRYLDAAERAEYQALNPQAQRLWLLGRIAAKDAVRHALWSGGNGALFPIEVPLVSQADGPVVSPADGPVVSPADGPVVSPADGPVVSPADGPVVSPADGPVETPLDGDCVVVRSGPAQGWRVAVGVAQWIGVAAVDRAAIRVAPVEGDATELAARWPASSRPSPRRARGSPPTGWRRRCTMPPHPTPGPPTGPRPAQGQPWPDRRSTSLPGPQPVDQLDAPAGAAPSQDAVLADLRRMIIEVIGEDYVTDTEIDLDTSFYEELEIESIEFVALGEALQAHYGERVDFAAWIATLEVDDIIGMTVGGLTDYIVASLSSEAGRRQPSERRWLS